MHKNAFESPYEANMMLQPSTLDKFSGYLPELQTFQKIFPLCVSRLSCDGGTVAQRGNAVARRQ